MSNHGDQYDVIVVGGGPSGMMAAGCAGMRGLRVLLLEKNPILGKKLSITGGGRCNVTNGEEDIRILLSHYGNAEQFLYSAFSQFKSADTVKFFESHGLPLKTEDRKRMFPKSERAPDVTRTMVQFLKKAGVEVRTGVSVRGFQMNGTVVSGVITDSGVLSGHSYIMASGGRSHAETGSTGEGVSWLKTLGHKTHDANPNLVPLITKESWLKKISGTVLKDVGISFCGKDKKVIKKRGNILITHFGLSGPLILNAAHSVKTLLKDGNVTATIDLFPSEDIGTVRRKLQDLLSGNPKKTVINTLKEWFPRGIAEAVSMVLPETGESVKSARISREMRVKLVDRMKALHITITGTMGYDWAVVSDGGVDLTEIDTRTMQSKIHKNLYVIGDMLHINRPSGGYSLQLCWTTGYVAGSNIIKKPS